ncbi:phosphoribosyltransferase family protein [Erysipelothrix amsterdamensis]|uniref:phosphoribosyltransferase family protein n=1 Tax=Erysipelothrix amsterdamensis TaxID=2929157 RepID=UPI0020A7506A
MFEYHRFWIQFHYSRYEYVIAPSNTTNSSKPNHLDLLVDKLGLKHSGINLVSNAPIKQALCNSKDRRKIRDHIALEKLPQKRTTKILIIDDIVTTGNTLEAIADQIKPFVDHIEALCLAGTLTNHK